MTESDKRRSFNFADLIIDTARRKLDAADARRSGTPIDAEAPRAVYQQACERIAADLAADGFRYIKSGSRATRKVNGVVQRVQFQSDHNNVAGRHVGLVIGAGAEAPALAKWLSASDWPFESSGVVGGGQIGNLVEPHGWWKWQLADPATREAQIADAIEQVRNIVLPFFARFDDLDRLADALRSKDMRGIDEETATAICYWRLGKEAAGDIISRQVSIWSGSAPDRFRAERDRVLRGGAPVNIHGDSAKRLGAVAAALNIVLGL